MKYAEIQHIKKPKNVTALGVNLSFNNKNNIGLTKKLSRIDLNEILYFSNTSFIIFYMF